MTKYAHNKHLDKDPLDPDMKGKWNKPGRPSKKDIAAQRVKECNDSVKEYLPDLPPIPPMYVPKYNNPTHNRRKDRLGKLEKRAISRLLNIRELNPDQVASLSPRSPIVKLHGCKLCPYYGSSRCYHELVPPRVHEAGICNDRVSEILEYAKMSASISGKEILRNEILHKIRNNIVLLESNLVDYRDAKLKLFNDGYTDHDGNFHEPLPHENFGTKEIMFDDYEQKIMAQIQLLSAKYAEYLNKDLEIENKKPESSGNKKKISIQQFNQFIIKGNKQLEDKSDEGGSL